MNTESGKEERKINERRQDTGDAKIISAGFATNVNDRLTRFPERVFLKWCSFWNRYAIMFLEQADIACRDI